MNVDDLIARIKMRIDDFSQATMQLERMTYSQVDAELDAEIIRHLKKARAS